MVNQQVKGFVKEVRVKHKDGTFTRLAGFDNLITDAGLRVIADNEGSFERNNFRYGAVGTGTEEPQESDTSLGSILPSGGYSDLNGGSFTTTGYQTDANGSSFTAGVKTFQWQVGEVVGNITEFGVSTSASGTQNMLVKVLLKDANGDPTSISLTIDDQLFIEWEFRLYYTAQVTNGSFDFTDSNGTTSPINYTISPVNRDSRHTLSNIGVGYASVWTEQPILSGSGPDDYTLTSGSSTSLTYDDALNADQLSKTGTISSTAAQFEGTIYGVAILQQNVAGGSARTFAKYSIEFDTPIVKTFDDTLSLSFNYSFSRYVAP